MTPYDKRQIWDELKRLEKEKANTCPVREMNSRINYLETVNNELRNDVRRLKEEMEEISEVQDDEGS